MHNIYPTLQASCFTQLRHEARSYQLHLPKQNKKFVSVRNFVEHNKGGYWKECRDAGEPCGAIRDVKVDRRVVGFGDGAIEPPRCHRVAEFGLLERVGGVQNSERCFHQ
ncbi:hypothetical protein A2U01_0016763, partial [Trifolium medium]|nr:hypothetical protein [Trifolium medium]